MKRPERSAAVKLCSRSRFSKISQHQQSCRFNSIQPFIVSGLLLAVCLITGQLPAGSAEALQSPRQTEPAKATNLAIPAVDSQGLSPYWGPEIQQWGSYIDALANAHGFHPDFVAAIIHHESAEELQEMSNLGAGGLMSLRSPTRPPDATLPADALLAPPNDLRWGMVILSYIVQQSGGDLFTALAAYRGGWAHVGEQLAREYAARVLDSYARALILRAGISPQMASRWTVAVEVRAGDVPAEAILVLGNKPISGLRLFAEHVVYAFADDRGHTHYIRGFVVPVSLSEYLAVDEAGTRDELEPFLRARLGDKSAQIKAGSSKVLMVCILGMERLRGKVTTRWYAPSDCPALDR